MKTVPWLFSRLYLSGTPVIAADHPSLRAMIRHQSEGLLFPSGSLASLTATLQDGLAASDEIWTAYSRAALQAHAARFSEEANYSELISIYQTAIAARAARSCHAQTRVLAKTSGS